MNKVVSELREIPLERPVCRREARTHGRARQSLMGKNQTQTQKTKMKLYRITIGKRVAGNNWHDWYSGQLEHLATYGDANEAKAHLQDGNPDGSEQWPEVYDEAGNRMVLQGRKLVRLA